MEEQKVVQRNLALQREWYGEPLGDRVRRLVVAFDVSQANLAEVLGISAPMLSQVMSGRRAKIGNPAVLARMIMLERKVLTPEVVSGEREALHGVLEEVRQSRPTVGRDSVPVGSSPDDAVVLTVLKEAIEEDGDLDKAARLLDDDFPALADLVRRAGEDF
ncbi:hypothetical protein EV191_108233 [Tamaricihabitans halophyticus]|uniref:Helix-turn-helix protein n=1 Tax=Tamaricihabitans halophyticus TaxID=1262583 RepID=A0A4R2QMQ5_9PSEU|nr:helix-turn-helix transcriptional regulator [Tamaricihabitans halophyticus]TCP50144.1 hypothetical protein EV191_108233 [Tamaricihabitans halophyticus]